MSKFNDFLNPYLSPGEESPQKLKKRLSWILSMIGVFASKVVKLLEQQYFLAFSAYGDKDRRTHILSKNESFYGRSGET